jgi:Zn-dependent M28 family amino/carboxypeptidase
MKKILLLSLILLLVFSLTGCPLIDRLTGRSDTGYTPADVAGVYVYEIWEGDPVFNITYHIVTLNADGTCHERYEWVSLSGIQKTTQDGADGTWELEGNKVTLTWNEGGSIQYELDKNRLKWNIETGYQTNEFNTVLFKKE